ncbi:hypothetical protein MNR01_02125 [Lysobacter sp. S4-A87]|uniref:hypothetical protein n=1 Tax=Lysobacter sp. S4-A87 TaxID=2925843 RepID=UPI001F53AA20|nr:hypothetical protein [Lysobacter sp. S4-A87]UNK49858.1 hypothetical protein MNR01_02125 [Lysobacter sp. S4-A87]
MPLIEVPAVGWEWAELPGIQRRNRRRLMLRPEIGADAVMSAWKRVPEQYRRAIFVAEASVWALGIGNARMLEALRYMDDDSEGVWRDLLTLLCVSWQNVSAPSLALLGVPLTLYGEHGVQRFGGRNRPVLLEDPRFSSFCALGEPSERRACMLMAMDAIRHEYLVELLPLFGTEKFGWKKIVKGMPAEAWAWLESRAESWPPRWRYRFGDWRELRESRPRSIADARRLRGLL